jgi:hypothetical protein
MVRLMSLTASCRHGWAIVGAAELLCRGMFQPAEAAPATNLMIPGGYL